MSKSYVLDKDILWNRIKSTITKLNGHSVEAGLFADKTEDGDKTMAEVGATHEYGSVVQRIPRRPFISQAFDTNIDKVEHLAARQFGLLTMGIISVEQVLPVIGLFMESAIKESILNGNWVPNSPTTIARKKSSQPLIDTGRMRQSVKYIKVVGGKVVDT